MDPLLLDIRSPTEYAAGHLAGALLVPTRLPPLGNCDIFMLGLRLMEMLGEADKSRTIYVYCKRGVRAQVAVELLQCMGYENVESMGGIETTLADASLVPGHWW